MIKEQLDYRQKKKKKKKSVEMWSRQYTLVK